MAWTSLTSDDWSCSRASETSICVDMPFLKRTPASSQARCACRTVSRRASSVVCGALDLVAGLHRLDGRALLRAVAGGHRLLVLGAGLDHLAVRAAGR